MNPWISRIALIAYVVGGWLMPALHHHDHSHAGIQPAAHPHSACCSAQPVGETAQAGSLNQPADQLLARATPPVVAPHSHCGCDHTHDHQPPARSTNDILSLADSAQLTAAHSHADCAGLCALCVGASLVASASDREAVSMAPVCDTDLLQSGNLAWPLQPLASGISARGPPASSLV
ncbi:hypothetical protein [Neorhodopirellula lusitana]|uniref:hypothetical protein n=1 Tax=Neorhodopirellula lusitana TaxID=445327 RepID=UPI0024B64AF0|nr:hypothetical protein [Neorhodopirellula lusitana]